jgi:hypothetical protein
LTVDEIIIKIADLQETANRNYFPEGLFESYRGNSFLGYHRADTNVFFTAITIFTLNTLKGKLSDSTQLLIDRITQKAVATYPLFKNKDGLDTYNFFQTKPSQHFPHGKILHKLTYFKIPDDIDDTALVFLTKKHTELQANWLKNKLIVHSNGQQKTIENTFVPYRKLKAYSTWFGKNMYIEFDACALSNMIYCLLSYQLPLDEYSHDSISYIQQTILSNQYLTQPFRVAHQYARTPLIMYHVARLMGSFNIPALEICREKLIGDMLYYLKEEALPLMDKILIEISLLRLNVFVEKSDIRDFSTKTFAGFHFFIAGFLTAYENPLLYKMASSKLFHIHWTCEAHCWALLAEWMTISSEKNLGHFPLQPPL